MDALRRFFFQGWVLLGACVFSWAPPVRAQQPNPFPSQSRDAEWANLRPLLALAGVPEAEKAKWSMEFLRAYRQSPGIEPAMALELVSHVAPGPLQTSLKELAAAAVPAEKPARPSFIRRSRKKITPAQAGIRWIPIPGGSFMMGASGGNEAPIHPVSVKGFDMARNLVTNQEYRTCVEAGICTAPDPSCLTAAFLGDTQPVVCVTWQQAKTFSKWVGGRLPTEAEWEYAARGAGKDQPYPWGAEPATCRRAVINEGDYGCGRQATWPVCSKTAGNTTQGLCDMAGNAWEWAEDWYHDSYEGAPGEASAWKAPKGSYRVLRGGSWRYEAAGARAAYRFYYLPNLSEFYIGFRPVRSNR